MVMMAVSTYLLLRCRSRRQRGHITHIVQKAPWHECISAFGALTTDFLGSLPVRSASYNVQNDDRAIDALCLSEDGMAFADVVAHIKKGVVPRLSAQRGPRYLAYVTGGATPVATFADWLVSTFDQSVKKHGCSIASCIERQTLLWLTELFILPPTFQGTFTTGATAANFLALLSGRQFLGEQQDLDANLDGISEIKLKCFSASPHESMLKCLGFSGIGQRNLHRVDTISAESECMDVNALATALSLAGDGVGKLVIASAGTVSGTSFDDIYAIRQVCNRFGAWLHVDAAFGIYERLLSGPSGRTKYAGVVQ
jgi:glutamate/tyrosine decarboxylase-like PLP-dependent enzyme